MTAQKLLLRATLALSFGLAVWSSAFSQALPVPTPPPVNFPVTTSGNLTTFGGATANAANAGSFRFGNAANGPVFADAPSTVRTPGGSTVAVNVRSGIAKPELARALGRFAGKAIPLAAAAIALFELARELGFTGSRDNNGMVTFTKDNPGVTCSNGTCTQYAPPIPGPTVWSNSASGAGGQWASWATGQSNYNHVIQGCTPAGLCTYTRTQKNDPLNIQTGEVPMNTQTLPESDVSTSSPATLQQFTDAIATQSGWPSGSAVGRALEDAIRSGESVQVTPQTVTGPASSPGSQTVTNNGPQTSTINTTNNYRYDGPTVATTQTSVSTTVDNATGLPVGSPVTSTTTPETPAKPAEAPEIETCGLPGKPACLIDETGTAPAVPAAEYSSKLDPLKTSQDDHTSKVGSKDDKPSFAGWTDFFTTPALATCTPVDLPNFKGASMGALDPCPVVGGVRMVMAYLWALGGVYLCLGFINKAI